MAWRKHDDRFPAPLREFRESEWPPVPGECLGKYACRGNGYGGPCVPRPGEYCGQACYQMLARDHGSEVLAAAKASDAFTRYRQARLGWLGEGTEGWITEFCEGHRQHDAIRYAPSATTAQPFTITRSNRTFLPDMAVSPGLEKGSFASGEYVREGADRHGRSVQKETDLYQRF